MTALTIDPDAMLTIAAVVCVLVIGAYLAGSSGSSQLQRELRPTEAHERRMGYSEAMRYLSVSEHHPAGMLVGLWGSDAGAEAWWWRCSLCREYDLRLSPDACAAASAGHACSPIDLEAAKAAAKAMHPAYRPSPQTDLGSPR